MLGNVKKINKNKSGMVFWEFIIIAFSFVIMGVVIFMAMSYAIAHGNTISANVPELKYKFPSVFVHTFLMQELTLEDKEEIFGDSEGNYYVKDLIWLNDENFENNILSYRNDYLKMIYANSEDMFQNYGSFIGKDFSSSQYLLDIRTNVETLPDLRKYINDGSYYYYIKTSDGSYTIIYFYKDGSVPESINDIDRTL